MDTSMRPKRRNHFGTWFVVVLGLLEIGAIVAFVEVKGVAGAACSASGIPQTIVPVGASAQHMPIGVGNGGADAMPSADAGGAQQPVVAASAAAPAPADSAAAPADGASGGDASVKGDTNQIIDPNCAGRTAASLLASGTPAPGPTTTCGPMKQPEALKEAEKQISH